LAQDEKENRRLNLTRTPLDLDHGELLSVPGDHLGLAIDVFAVPDLQYNDDKLLLRNIIEDSVAPNSNSKDVIIA
jgi:hypothetical protein